MNHILLSDFDETITLKDTIGILASLPYRKKTKLKPEWSFFVDNYMQGWNNYHKQFPPRVLPLINQIKKPLSLENFKSTLQQEFDYQAFCRKIELNSTNKLSEFGLFSNLNNDDIRLFANDQVKSKTVVLREGFKELLRSKLIKPEFVYIISVNWSKAFIYNIINEDVLKMENIFCNDLVMHHEQYSGMFSNNLLTGSDKIVTLETILRSKTNTLGQKNNIFWYIGDSETDLLPILHPLVNGILLLNPKENIKKYNKITKVILGIDAMILEKFESHDISIVEIPGLKVGTNKLYITKSWKDISKLITDFR